MARLLEYAEKLRRECPRALRRLRRFLPLLSALIKSRVPRFQPLHQFGGGSNSNEAKNRVKAGWLPWGNPRDGSILLRMGLSLIGSIPMVACARTYKKVAIGSDSGKETRVNVKLSDSQIRRARNLLAAHGLADHERRGLKILLGRHENRHWADMGREMGMSRYGVTKRCREIVSSGVDKFLNRLEREIRFMERARQFQPEDDVASLAREQGLSERRARHLLDRDRITRPSRRGFQKIEDLFAWANAASEPVIDLGGVSISATTKVAVLAVYEPAETQAHYRGYLHRPLQPEAYWTELSKQDQRFAKVFRFLRGFPPTPTPLHCDKELLRRVRSRFPRPYSVVIIAESPGDAEQWAEIASASGQVMVHCCGEPLFGWLERFFYTLRVEKSSAGLAPNLGSLYNAVVEAAALGCFEWFGSAAEAETVVRRRIAANLFHAAQGHVHELTPWLWSRARRENSTNLVTFRWNTKLRVWGERPGGHWVSLSPLPGIEYPLCLQAGMTGGLRNALRDTAHRVYFSNGLDAHGIRERHVLCHPDNPKQSGGGKKRPPGSAAVLLTRHLLFPPPPVSLGDLAAIVSHAQAPVERRLAAAAGGGEPSLVFYPPHLLCEIRASFESEVYADFVNEAASWEEQSLFNLRSASPLCDDACFIDAMEQLNPRMETPRPGASDAETEEQWRKLFTNCDADFLISRISPDGKHRLERLLDDWVEVVLAVIAEAHPLAGKPAIFRECFGECIAPFAAAQRRVARQAVETCARAAIAGLPPVVMAVVTVKEIITQFHRELLTRLRWSKQHSITVNAHRVSDEPRKDGLDESSLLLQDWTQANSDEVVWDIANTLVSARRALALRKSAQEFWIKLESLTLASPVFWEEALSLIQAEGLECGSKSRDSFSLFKETLLGYREAVAFVNTMRRIKKTGSAEYRSWINGVLPKK